MRSIDQAASLISTSNPKSLMWRSRREAERGDNIADRPAPGYSQIKTLGREPSAKRNEV